MTDAHGDFSGQPFYTDRSADGASSGCELCGCPLQKSDLQYELKIEIRPTSGFAAPGTDDDEAAKGAAADRDYLAELDDMLERVDDAVLGDFSELEHDEPMRFCLCHECSRRIRSQPLPRDLVAAQLAFSEN